MKKKKKEDWSVEEKVQVESTIKRFRIDYTFSRSKSLIYSFYDWLLSLHFPPPPPSFKYIIKLSTSLLLIIVKAKKILYLGRKKKKKNFEIWY